MEFRRSLLFIPGSKPDHLKAAEASVADIVVADLEDGVSPTNKDAALENALEILAGWDTETPLGIRINGIDTPRGIPEIRRIIAAEVAPDFLAIPDVRGPNDVQIVGEAVRGTEIELLPLIEQPSAVFEVYDIVHATPQIYGLLFAAIDFQMNMDMAILGASDLSVPRYLVSMAASAGGVPAFDKPILVDDEDALASEISRARELGYDGKLAITMEQAAAINEGFLPSDEELAEAKRIVEAFEDSESGLVEVDGIFVDKPLIDQLRNHIEIAEAAGRRIE